ncbi:TPA: hypothetical protein DCL30_02210 [Candidatus Peribacteria bacterium]|nr:MAG: hypothetical protein A3J91_04095 [Candidatus Peribacteria bacterium RIFOXYC2_FULL_58_10]OGJ84569.1 MAG: hypothetical protein A2529_05955 [Candidatus Peribacteria bacterium RIFOXYD2_FULL_58_15]HAI98340.1 hypothetical protein [Candidatus Peribacteria bacterium]HAS33761.1 hypothetical protein [Candidatus Peribacteria bacterium]
MPQTGSNDEKLRNEEDTFETHGKLENPEGPCRKIHERSAKERKKSCPAHTFTLRAIDGHPQRNERNTEQDQPATKE